MRQQEKGKVARVSFYFMRLLKISVGLFLRLRYRLVAEHLEVLGQVKPPYVVLPNHITTWDPFFVGLFMPAPVYNVTSDFQFRRRIMRLLHRLVGSIPKSKVIPDIETIKRILEVRRNKGIIGIYPEGMRTWDGHTAVTISQTAKLLKLLKIPVISVVMKGAYLSLPRWTKRSRRGRVTIAFTKLFDGADLKRLSLEEIQTRVDEALRHDEYAFQQEQMVPYRGSRPAENLELALFICPQCNAIGRLHSRGRRLTCLECNYSVWYNDYGFLQRRTGRLYFDTVRHWNLWQQERLEGEIVRSIEAGNREAIIEDHDLKMFVGYRTKPVRRRASGKLTLYPHLIDFSSTNGASMRFPLDDIDGINVQIGEHLEFYRRKVLYRFQSKDRSVSAYKWMCAIEILQRLSGPIPSQQAI